MAEETGIKVALKPFDGAIFMEVVLCDRETFIRQNVYSSKKLQLDKPGGFLARLCRSLHAETSHCYAENCKNLVNAVHLFVLHEDTEAAATPGVPYALAISS